MKLEETESKIKFILAVSALLTLYYSFHGLLESDPKASASVVQVQKDVNRLEKRLDKAVDREYKRWEMEHGHRNHSTDKRSTSTTIPGSAKQQSYEARKGKFF